MRAFLASLLLCMSAIGLLWCFWGGQVQNLLAAAPTSTDPNLESEFKDLARKLGEIKKVAAVLEKELSTVLSVRAQQAIRKEADREVRVAEVNPYLANQPLRDAIRHTLVEQRQRQAAANFERKAFGTVDLIREKLELTDGEVQAIRPIYRQILLDYGEWDKQAGRIRPAEALAQCRSLADRLEREVAGALPDSKFQLWLQSGGADWIRKNDIYLHRAAYEADHTRPDDPFYPR